MPVEQVPEQDRAALESLRLWIEKYTGISYRAEASPILYNRLMQLCFKHKIRNLAQLYADLSSQNMPDLSLKIAQTVSTTHTYFFRERESYEYLMDEVQAGKLSGPLRIWSAAASSGEEAFTLAMYLAETLGLHKLNTQVQILGTDINAHVIRQAEHAIYPQDRLKDLPESHREKYFIPVGLGQYQVIPELRRLCTFRRINLKNTHWPFQQKFHLIFCRNVLYYFQSEQQAQLIEAMYRQAEAGAYLVTSVTESLSRLNTSWRKIQPAIYCKPST